MSDSTLTQRQLVASLPHYFKGAVEAVIENNVIYHLLKKKGRIKTGRGGTALDWAVDYGNLTAQDYGPYQVINLDPTEARKRAQVTWAGKSVGGFISEWELNENSGGNRLLALYEEELKRMRRSCISILKQSIWNDRTGGDPFMFDGIKSFVSASNTYAGLSQTTYSWWRANLNTCTDWTNAWLQDITKLVLELSRGTGGDAAQGFRPDIALCDEDKWTDLMSKLFEKQRYVGNKDLADAGFANIVVAQVPHTADHYCDASKIYYLNSDFLEICGCPKGELMQVKTWDSENPAGRALAASYQANMKCELPARMGLLTIS